MGIKNFIKMMMIIATSFLVFTSTLVFAQGSTTLTFNFSGKVTENGAGILFPGKSIGDSYTGTFTVYTDAILLASTTFHDTYDGSFFDLTIDGTSYRVNAFKVYDPWFDGIEFLFDNNSHEFNGFLALRSSANLYVNRNVPTTYEVTDFDNLAEITISSHLEPIFLRDRCSILAISPDVASVPEIEVPLESYNFGDVRWGQISTMMFTISNLGGDVLTISDISLNDVYGVFSIDPILSLPLDLLPGESTDLGVIFNPDAIQSYSSTLAIESNDANEPLIEVALSGTGVLSDTPSEQVAAIIDYIKNSIATGELTGEGPGNSADKRVNALINMIEAAGNLLEEGQIAEGCQQLGDIYLKIDSVNLPPDFVSGPATAGLASGIEGLMEYYGCE